MHISEVQYPGKALAVSYKTQGFSCVAPEKLDIKDNRKNA
jgi:hypothetical protein